MKALVVRKSIRRFAAAKILAHTSTKRALEYGPLSLEEATPPPIPTPNWRRLQTIQSGICGSDISSLTLHTSRYFEPLTSFPFSPGHEIVAYDPALDHRVVIEPALTCEVRGVTLCRQCRIGQTQRCESIMVGDIEEGIQLGFCSSTGGGWAEEFVAHESQIWEVPNSLSDDDAVMVEPLACALHGAMSVPISPSDSVAIIGAGTVGLCTLAALRALYPELDITIGAKHAVQREASRRLGATSVIRPQELQRSARRSSLGMSSGSWLSSGYDIIFDCVGSSDSLTQALESVRPGGTIVLSGMPSKLSVDLAPLWHREVKLQSAYAYGYEQVDIDTQKRLAVEQLVKNAPDSPPLIRTFALALHLMETAHLGWMVTHHYPIEDFSAAIDRASKSGSVDALKVVFEFRTPQKSTSERTS